MHPCLICGLYSCQLGGASACPWRCWERRTTGLSLDVSSDAATQETGLDLCRGRLWGAATNKRSLIYAQVLPSSSSAAAGSTVNFKTELVLICFKGKAAFLNFLLNLWANLNVFSAIFPVFRVFPVPYAFISVKVKTQILLEKKTWVHKIIEYTVY